MSKRTIATIRQLITEVNSVLPTAPAMSFRKKGMDRYILIFEGVSRDREFGPLSCGEACEFINGIIYSRMETVKLLNKQALYVVQLEDEIENKKPSNCAHKGTSYLSLKLYADNQTAAAEAYKAEVAITRGHYEQRIVENAKALHKMFVEKETLKKNFDEAMGLLTGSMKTLVEKVASLEHTLEEEAHMHNEG